MSDLNWLGKAFCKPKAGKRLAKTLLATVIAVALVLGVGLAPIAPLLKTAQASASGRTLHVAEWEGPTTLGNVSGRPTVLKVGDEYHMWYSPSDDEIYHTSSTDPASFEPATAVCTFVYGGAPAEVGSVTVVEEDGTFYMIAYELSGPTDANKKFAIYTSTDGNVWAYGRTVFDGTGLPSYNKIDGPYLFEDDGRYRLYFQVKSPDETRYNIYTAESDAESLAAIADGDTDFNLVGTLPVLSHSINPNDWDGAYVMHPWVVKDDDGTYYMWYSAHDGTNPQRLGIAKSEDGITWVKSPGNPIIPDPQDGFGEPSVIKDGEKWHMWAIANPASFLAYDINYYTATGPFEFSSIQEAINAASEGDTILVAPGTYVQNSNITVPEGVTLELSPGTTLKFAEKEEGAKIGIAVNGTLIAEGTESEKITFTSNEEEPEAGDWNGIDFGTTATDSIIDNCVIEYAHTGVKVAWTTITKPETAPITVQNSILQNISYRGVSFAGHDEGSASPRLYYPVTDIEIVNNEFIDVGKSGAGANPMAVFTRSVEDVEISGNLFQGGEGTYLAYLGVAFENYTFADNTIQDPGYQQGVYISTTNGNPQILGNKFTGEATASNFRCISTYGHTGLTIKNNEFRTGSSGIYIVGFVNSPDVVDVLIEGNIFVGVGSGGDDSYAIVDDSWWNTPRPPDEGWNVRSWVRDGVIKNNVIRNTNGVAIWIPRGSHTFPGYEEVDLGDVLIEGNTIEKNTVGIQVGLTAGDDAANYGIEGIEAHYNNIVGNDIGIKNISVSGEVFDATLNWWGDASGPSGDVTDPVTDAVADGTGDKVSGNVRFDPWLKSDIFPPEVVSTNPNDGATGVSRSQIVTVTFHEDIQGGEYFDNIAVKTGNISESISCSISDDTLSIRPVSRWAYGTTYTVSIPGGAVCDMGGGIDGSPLPNVKHTFTFTTLVPPAPIEPTPTPPVTPPGAIEPVTDSIVADAIREAEETGEVVIEVPEEEIALTADQLERIADVGKPAVIRTDEVEFVLPPEIVADLAETDAVQIEITAKEIAEDEAPTTPSDLKLIGKVFEIEIASVDEEGNKHVISRFARPLEVSFPVPSSAKDAAAGKLDVYRYDEETKIWEAMGGTYDAATNAIIFTTNHLSKYALMERTTPPIKTFIDIEGHWAQSDIEVMAGLGIVLGISEDIFAPEMPVGRAQFAAFLIRSLDIEEVSPATPHFNDLQPGAWYYGAVEGAYAAGLINGYEDGTFRPEQEITREEMAALVVRALKYAGQEVIVDDIDAVLARFEDAGKISPWAKEEAAQAVASGIIIGRDGLFAPKDSATRAEAVVMLKRMLVKLGVI